ncbi:VOC family protein [Candidatus Enterococcus mansonii]|uniref:VOC domain-containing protein n=1 Tax=Candidatus Enterococcus mansonii TaxID=1834181 RepID=A0ABU8IHR9_9ENTE
MEEFKLSENVYIKTIAIRVKDVEKMVNFYKNVLGFVLKLEENNLSIFGSQEKNSRLLILEESETNDVQMEAQNQLIRFSLFIPTEEEFSSLLRRITTHHYPISNSEQKGRRRSVFLEDPEGNELEISYQYKGRCEQHDGSFDIQTLIKQSNVLYSNLSKDVRFDRMLLRVTDKKGHHYFYQKIIGITEGTNDELMMNNGLFSVYLEEFPEKSTEQVQKRELQGVDFLFSP